MSTQAIANTAENRWQSRLACGIGTQVEVRYEFRKGDPVLADVVDLHKSGCGLSLPASLESGASVLITGLQTSGTRRIAGRVVWCRLTATRGYRAGIAFFQPLQLEDVLPPSTPEPDESQGDLYEDLEIHPTATEETVTYVYRLLEHRYRPENPYTANPEKLTRVQRAYSVLGVAANRAAYDQTRAAQAAAHRPTTSSPPADVAAQSATERSKRWDLLGLLYAKRLQAPTKPGLTLSEVEAVMGLLKEDVEFAFWYLQESGLAIPDHGHNRYSISVKGVDFFEQHLNSAGSVHN